MENQPYNACLDRAAEGGLRWDTDTFVLSLLTSYTFDANHASRAAVASAGTVVATGSVTPIAVIPHGIGTAENLDITDGPTAPPGLTIRHMVVSTNTGNAATDVPLFYYGQDIDGVDLSIETNGGPIQVQWSTSEGAFQFLPWEACP